MREDAASRTQHTLPTPKAEDRLKTRLHLSTRLAPRIRRRVQTCVTIPSLPWDGPPNMHDTAYPLRIYARCRLRCFLRKPAASAERAYATGCGFTAKPPAIASGVTMPSNTFLRPWACAFRVSRISSVGSRGVCLAGRRGQATRDAMIITRNFIFNGT